mgnify:CR=1 FL=1
MQEERREVENSSEPRYFVGDVSKEPFKTEARGYMVGFFMGDKTSPDDGSLDILARTDVECAWMSLPEIDESKPHYHMQGYEITICVSGELRLIVDQNEEVILHPRQFIIIPSGTVLQNPENAPGTEVIVVRNISIPGDKDYAEPR